VSYCIIFSVLNRVNHPSGDGVEEAVCLKQVYYVA